MRSHEKHQQIFFLELKQKTFACYENQSTGATKIFRHLVCVICEEPNHVSEWKLNINLLRAKLLFFVIRLHSLHNPLKQKLTLECCLNIIERLVVN